MAAIRYSGRQTAFLALYWSKATPAHHQILCCTPQRWKLHKRNGVIDMLQALFLWPHFNNQMCLASQISLKTLACPPVTVHQKDWLVLLSLIAWPPFPDVHFLDSSHIGLKSNFCNNPFTPIMITVTLLPRLNSHRYTQPRPQRK